MHSTQCLFIFASRGEVQCRLPILRSHPLVPRHTLVSYLLLCFGLIMKIFQYYVKVYRDKSFTLGTILFQPEDRVSVKDISHSEDKLDHKR